MEAVTLRARGGIDRARMQIRVAGKGAKERVLPMSPHLLYVLEEYWLAERKGRPGHGSPWLFLGEDQQSPICAPGSRVPNTWALNLPRCFSVDGILDGLISLRPYHLAGKLVTDNRPAPSRLVSLRI